MSLVWPTSAASGAGERNITPVAAVSLPMFRWWLKLGAARHREFILAFCVVHKSAERAVGLSPRLLERNVGAD